jgi:SNF2 family DNA or RNA helicase
VNAVSVVGSEIVVRSDWKYKDLLKAIPGRRWDPEVKGWCYPILPATIRSLHEVFGGRAEYDGEFQALVNAMIVHHQDQSPINHTLADRDLPQPPIRRTEAWNHQRIGYHLIADQAATMLAFDMGTGKTKVAVDATVNLECGLVLVVCPLAVVTVWPREFDKHAGRNVLVIPLHRGRIADRAEIARREIRTAMITSRQLVLVVNYEAVWRDRLGELVRMTPWDMVICDESHRIKAPQGVASKFIAQLTPISKRRLCLTGTPMPHSPLDVFGQYRFLDPSIFGRSFVSFRANYAHLGGHSGKEVLSYKNLDELSRKFYLIGYRVMKQDVLDLPDVLHQTIEVSLSDKAARIYSDLELDLMADVGTGVVTAANALSRLLRLQQVTSGYAMVKPAAGDEEATLHEIDSTKEEALAEILSDIPESEPVVVFGRFTHDLHRIRKVCNDIGRKCYELSGHAKELDEWQADTGGAVLAAQIQTGREGIDLSRACYCIYYSLGYSLGDYEQSLARTHRPGQKRAVTYLHLVCSGTVDQQVYGALSERRQVVEYVLETLKQKGDTTCQKPRREK